MRPGFSGIERRLDELNERLARLEPEVVTEGKDIEECRMMLRDAFNEMLVVYKQQRNEIPIGGVLIEQVPIEIQGVYQTA